MLQLVQVKHVLNLSVVLAALNWAEIIVLNRIDKNAVFPHHAQLDDVVCEFDPLKRFVVVDINLIKELDQVTHEGYPVASIWQMLEHDFYKVAQAEAISATEKVVVVVNAF